MDYKNKSRLGIGGVAISAALLVAMANHEGFRGEAYYATQDEKQRGISTIGFGSTPNVKPGDKITVERALVLLLADANRYEQAVKRCTPVPMHQYEFDAYVSLTYNIGEGAYCRSTLAKKLNKYDYTGACKEILKWDQQSGKVLPGLTKRRKHEYKLCIGES